jgi:hypothetical protein
MLALLVCTYLVSYDAITNACRDATWRLGGKLNFTAVFPNRPCLLSHPNSEIVHLVHVALVSKETKEGGIVSYLGSGRFSAERSV